MIAACSRQILLSECYALISLKGCVCRGRIIQCNDKIDLSLIYEPSHFFILTLIISQIQLS